MEGGIGVKKRPESPSLKSMKPDQRFDIDPTTSIYAMIILKPAPGRGTRAFIPFISGIPAIRKELKDLGLL
jgi:hypothetical protein